MNRIILASQSPRRKQIMEGAGITFESRSKDTNEDFPATMPPEEVPVYLAQKKAAAFLPELQSGETLITADTVVIVEGKILNKPADKKEATEMLQLLSGKMHQVITGVCIHHAQQQVSFSDLTRVYFLPLLPQDIDYYIDHYKPFDKAGSYGIQEYIGYIGIEKIEGSYFNVMGLPIHKVMAALRTLSLV